VVTPEIDNSWAVSGTRETRQNLLSSILLDFDQMEAFNKKLQEKYRRMEREEQDWEGYLLDDADIVLVSYGISSRISHSAVDAARARGIRAGLLRPLTLFPFPKDKLKELAAKPGMSFLSVEMSNGQMMEDIRLAIDCSRSVELVNRMGGNLILLDVINQKIEEMAGKI